MEIGFINIYKSKNFIIIMKSKRGISIMIGYVLLIVFALIMGTIVYNVIKTYVPKNVIECPDSVSIFIDDLIYTEDSLEITITNNGLFNIAGYFIRATNSSSQKIATKDLSEFLSGGDLAKELNNVVIFINISRDEDNPMKPNEKQTQIFNLSGEEEIYSIEIIPVRFQKENNKNKFVSCGSSKIREVVRIGSGTCTPNCDEIECGLDPICRESCGTCEEPDVCNSTGQCESTEEISESIVFISSETYNGNLGGTTGADAKCQALAITEGLSGTFVAWLSNSTTDAKDKIILTEIPFNLIDGTVIANNLADLIDETLDNQINIDETDNPQNAKEVWTGTLKNGTKDNKHCNDWSSTSEKGRRGKSDKIDGKWTDEKDKECAATLRLYCFQVS